MAPDPSHMGTLRSTEMDKIFGRNAARHRLAAGLDQYTLADMLTASSGWTWNQNMVSKIELGNRPTRVSEAYALAAALNTTVDILAGKAEGGPEAAQTFAQLAELRKMQSMLRHRERALLTDIKTNTTKPMRRKKPHE